MKSVVSHRGIVTKSGDGFVTVNIAPEANECSGCAIAGMCTKNEEMTVPYTGDGSMLIGKEVTISAPTAMQHKAVVVFFVVPIVILIGMLFASLAIGCSEAIASVIAICSVALWFAIMWLMKVRLFKRATFTLTHI